MEIAENFSEKAQRDLLLVTDALQNGNQKAYARLMSFYRDPIYFMILKLCNNPYDAEDLTIEAFGKAFKNLVQFTGDYAFSTWLFRIAANNCIDFLRRKNKSPRCMEEDIENYDNQFYEEYLVSSQNTPEESIIEKQRIKMMHLAVDQLRPKYKALIRLRYFDEYSYEEISKELNISVNNVKIQLFRAKQMLASIMENIKQTI